jgi:hypothetical protein
MRRREEGTVLKTTAALIAAAVVLLAPATAQASRPTSVTHALDYMHTKQRDNASFSASDPRVTFWSILAISAGKEAPKKWIKGTAKANPISYLQTINMETQAATVADPNVPVFYSMAILAYHSADANSYIYSAGSTGVDLLAKLANYKYVNKDKSLSNYSPAATSNPDYLAVETTAWAVLALEATNSTVDASTINWLVGQQNGSDGGWGDEPHAESNVNDTGLVLLALHAFGYSATSKEMTDGLAYLKAHQRGNGGFAQWQSSRHATADATSWAIYGIRSAGANPSTILTNGHSPLGYLHSLQLSSGGVAPAVGDSASLGPTTRAVQSFTGALMPYARTHDPYPVKYRPYFKSVTPAKNGLKYTTSTVKVAATYADTSGGTGIKTSAVTVKLDGQGRTSHASISASSLSITFTGLSNAQHTVVIHISDKAGNTADVTRTFTVAAPTTGGGGGSGGGTTPSPRPTYTYHPPTTHYPTPTTSPVTTSSPTTGASGIPGTSPSSSPSTGGLVGPPTTGIPGTSATPLSSASVQGTVATTATGGGGGTRTAAVVGGILLALVPAGLAASFLVYRRRMTALAATADNERLPPASSGGDA